MGSLTQAREMYLQGMDPAKVEGLSSEAVLPHEAPAHRGQERTCRCNTWRNSAMGLPEGDGYRATLSKTKNWKPFAP